MQSVEPSLERLISPDLRRTCMQTSLTFIDVALLGILLCEWILHDDVLQPRLLEVLLAWCLIRAVLDGVLLHGLERERLSASHRVNVEELERLFTDLQKMVRRVPAYGISVSGLVRQIKWHTYPSMSVIRES